MARYGMVIDLHKCVGCSGCSIACKNENNVDTGMFWSHYFHETTGTFPNVNYKYVPTLCNHCEDAACVRVCPTEAMYKDENGLTLHDPDKCIGCKSCYQACPYGAINFNKNKPHRRWEENAAIIEGATASGKEVQERTGQELPYYNADRAFTYEGIRSKGIVEKCTFCDHRLKDGLKPYCVESCAADARTFGDLDDPNSEINKVLAQYSSRVLKPDKGTKPRVFYVRG